MYHLYSLDTLRAIQYHEPVLRLIRRIIDVLPWLFCRRRRLKLSERLHTDTNISRIEGAQAQIIASCISAMHQIRRCAPV